VETLVQAPLLLVVLRVLGEAWQVGMVMQQGQWVLVAMLDLLLLAQVPARVKGLAVAALLLVVAVRGDCLP
jgi:hypothetical protein